MPIARRNLSIAMSHSAIACGLYLAALGLGLQGCSDPAGPAVLTVAAVAATDGQTAQAGTSLPLPLQVLVQSDGKPKSGVTVTWLVSAGAVVPTASVTDLNGRASASWTLGPVAGAMSATTTVDGAQGSPVSFSATALAQPVTATVDSTSNNQTGVVGTALQLPLRVKVDSAGVSKAGVTVEWRTEAGGVAPTESVSDSDGFASAVWTLDTTPGVRNAYATIVGAPSSRMIFGSTALPGPPAAINAASGSGQTSSANHGPFRGSLLAVVTDRYGNKIQGQTVTWSVASGPVVLVLTDQTTDAMGRSYAIVSPSGTPGEAVVRSALPGVGKSTQFALSISPVTYDVVLHTSGPFAFVSSQNGSRNPAVDTIPAGRTMTWTLQFDYDLHGVAPVGTPTFQGGDFPYANPSTVSVTFATPGTYHYADRYTPLVTGIVVVR
jgi:plastocyanin